MVVGVLLRVTSFGNIINPFLTNEVHLFFNTLKIKLNFTLT